MRVFSFEPGGGVVVVAGHRFMLPRNKLARIVLGVALIIGGVFSFLPVLGLWMLPLGLLVLSQDIPAVRRWRRRIAVRWTRWRQKRA